MRVVNEKVARVANIEDDVTGRFWEGRFKSQALLDEKALLSCMAYVDLKPVRAKMAKTPEESDHTSIKIRVHYWKKASARNSSVANTNETLQLRALHLFAGNLRDLMPKGAIFSLFDYQQLLDWTKRQIRENKVGSIDSGTAPILKRLSIKPAHCVYLCTHLKAALMGWCDQCTRLNKPVGIFGRQRRPNLASNKILFT